MISTAPTNVRIIGISHRMRHHSSSVEQRQQHDERQRKADGGPAEAVRRPSGCGRPR